jgi:hypothetical protein
MIINSTNINKTTGQYSPQTIEHKKDHDVCVDWNSSPDFEQAHTCGGVKPGNEIPTLPS